MSNLHVRGTLYNIHLKTSAGRNSFLDEKAYLLIEILETRNFDFKDFCTVTMYRTNLARVNFLTAGTSEKYGNDG